MSEQEQVVRKLTDDELEAAEMARIAELREMENHRCPECDATKGYISLLVYETVLRQKRELRAQLKALSAKLDVVASYHDWIRNALGLDESAPRRFDYYAELIEGLRGSLGKLGGAVVPIHQYRHIRDDAGEWIDTLFPEPFSGMSQYETRTLYTTPQPVEVAGIITGTQLARAIFADGDRSGDKTQRIEFKGGAWPDHETDLGGYIEESFSRCLDRLLNTASIQVLDKPAKVGTGTFGIGIEWSTVIGAAQRQYEYSLEPQPSTEQIAEVRKQFSELMQQPDARIHICPECGVPDCHHIQDERLAAINKNQPFNPPPGNHFDAVSQRGVAGEVGDTLTLSTKTLQEVAADTCDEVIDFDYPRYIFTPDDLLVFVEALRTSKHLSATKAPAINIHSWFDVALDAYQQTTTESCSDVGLYAALEAVRKLIAAPKAPEAVPLSNCFNELLAAAKAFYNATIADKSVIIRPSDADMRDEIIVLGNKLRAAIESANSISKTPQGLSDKKIADIGTRLGKRLAELLDDDQWNNIEPLLYDFARGIERAHRIGITPATTGEKE